MRAAAALQCCVALVLVAWVGAADNVVNSLPVSIGAINTLVLPTTEAGDAGGQDSITCPDAVVSMLKKTSMLALNAKLNDGVQETCCKCGVV